jgi:hypothetical protein
MQEIPFEGKKTKHYILHINMDFKLVDLQKYAMIEPTKMLLELPAPEVEKDDILYQENAIIDVTPTNGVTPTDPQPKPVSYITDPQRKRLYAIAKKAGWQDDEIKKYLVEKYKIGSSTEIKRDDYETICEYFAKGPQPPEETIPEGVIGA